MTLSEKQLEKENDKSVKSIKNHSEISNSDKNCENVFCANLSTTNDISIRSLNESDQSSIYSNESNIVESSNDESNDVIPSTSHQLNLPGIYNGNIPAKSELVNTPSSEGLIISNLAIQKSNDVTIGSKTIYSYNGPVTINQIVSSDTIKQNGNDNTTSSDGLNINKRHRIGTNEVSNIFKNFYKSPSPDRPKFSKKIIIVALVVTILLIITSILCALLIKPDISPENWNISIINRTEWGADPPQEELKTFNRTPYIALIAHTVTLTCFTEEACKQRVKSIQKICMEDNHLDDIAYNFLVGGDGMVYEGCGWDKVGEHTQYYNNKSIGVAFIGDFMAYIPTYKQFKAAQWILEECVKNKKLTKDYKLYGVRQVKKSYSPGDNVYDVITKWQHWQEVTVD